MIIICRSWLADYFCIYNLSLSTIGFLLLDKETRGSVGWACVAHLSFCWGNLIQSSIGASHQVSVHLIWPSSLREDF
jgi:hypothetical protein